ncbi:MAG: hypothetical protein M1834_007575 [Cirrosporium novae-zelandiae]|nr:MAG: hypothetical protein M1834_007575 [Cirrosporium novae-zelandiae]
MARKPRTPVTQSPPPKPKPITPSLPPLLPVLPALNTTSLVAGTSIPPPPPSPPISPPGNPLFQHPVTSSAIHTSNSPQATESRPQTSPLPSPTLGNPRTPNTKQSLHHPLSPTSTTSTASNATHSKKRPSTTSSIRRLFSFRSFNSSSDNFLSPPNHHSPLSHEVYNNNNAGASGSTTSHLNKRKSMGWFRKVSVGSDMNPVDADLQKLQQIRTNQSTQGTSLNGIVNSPIPERKASPPPQLQLSDVVMGDTKKESGSILGAEDMFKGIK